MDKTITMSFDLEQVCNDVLAKCNLISMQITDAAMVDIRANVQEPDSPETRSIICRAITEAFGRVKSACQRYLTVGRTFDSNALERIVASAETDDSGNIKSMEYETVALTLTIPNFNTAVTDHLKSCIHKYVVDYVMARFLQDQVTDKAEEYKSLADDEDYNGIIKALNARERYIMRRPSFI